ncbi:MBL fold metallo-hydrolase [candidate division KSB1 bacterium]|nr:MBL fold metallo-hydrolase [candidate division KSB1 bacterium]NIR68811.1 MBL fold metallo-hydrolase [candidate division KSB1 bacterium]NIS27174.1 MBL fold metallo-hydrolase [candidate division KSB1 bacterium]NIT74059.1 MBL fold metallo-hydrolase [candidate division KSB1 bacterium]NIU26924.1 MBL fold metallo-hydrolase [candidate division KSB1 bacterium]
MIIERLEVGVFAENCYVVGCEETLEGVIIDPGDEVPRILDKVRDSNLRIKYILLTHGHLDHVKELNAVKESVSVPVLMHGDDHFLLDNLPAQAAAFGLTSSGIPKVDRYIDEGEKIEFGKIVFRTLHTPGHSPGSVSFVAGGVAFVGDALFAGSIGRTDLPGGDYDLLIESIKTKLFPLGDETVIYSGHGPKTTIGQEKQVNPFVGQNI